MRRFLALPFTLVLVVLLGASASALCMTGTLSEEVNKSDAVWWGTVTDASASQGTEPGFVRLRIMLLDVLKGPGAVGQTKTVYLGSCGPMISPEGAAKMAPGYVGKTQLFYGGLTKSGGLGQSETVLLDARGMSAEQIYRKAAAALGVAPVALRQSAVPGPSPATAGKNDLKGPSALLVVLLVAGALGLIIALMWLAGRRKGSWDP